MVKFKSVIVVFIVAIVVVGIGTALTMHFAYASQKQTVIQFSTNTDDDVRVGKLALEKIIKKSGITSNDYTYSYPVKQGTLDKTTGVREKVHHFLFGKSISGTAYATAYLKSEFINLKQKDVSFDCKTHTLSIILPKPIVKVVLDKKKTNENSFTGIFVSDYTADELLRVNQHIEDAGKVLFERNDRLMGEARNDIKSQLINLFSIDDNIKNVNISFKK